MFRVTMEGVRAPELVFEGPDDWINSTPLTVKELLESGTAAVLVDFWDYTCVNCIRTLPYLMEWWKRYKDKGLIIIGIHTPEFKFAGSRENVEQAVRRFGMEFPVLLDSEYINWTNFANRYWPRKYLIDRNGTIVYDHAGEGAYGATESKIQELIRRAAPNTDLPPLIEPLRPEDRPGALCYPTTPELYTGFRRGIFGNAHDCQPETVVNFNDPGRHRDDVVFLHGPWYCSQEFIRHARDTKIPEDYVLILYHALEVNTVLHSADGRESLVYVTQDGRPLAEEDAGSDIEIHNGESVIRVGEPRMYNIVRNGEFGSHELKLAPVSSDVEFYAFTFGSCEEPA